MMYPYMIISQIFPKTDLDTLMHLPLQLLTVLKRQFCCGFYVDCFSVSFGDVSPYILVRSWLLSGHLLGKSCSFG